MSESDFDGEPTMGQPTIETEPAPSRASRRRWWPVALVVGGIGFAVVGLRGNLPDLPATWTALRQASPAWLLVAAGLAVVSMGAFSEQQRRLLAAFGVRMPAVASLAVSYARSAMATALPGGTAVSAGYAFRRFRTHGASQPIAAAVMVLSGVASVAGIVVLYATEVLTRISWSFGTLAIAAVVVIVVATALIGLSGQRRPGTIGPSLSTGDRPRLDRFRVLWYETVALARTVPLRQWFGVIALAALNWLTDLLCLLAALHAVGLAVPVHTVATAYLAAQLIRQIPVTPGGIGVIEASLIIALTAAGAQAAPAAAAVLVYRLLSCWMIVPIGLLCWTAQNATAVPVAARATTYGWGRTGRAQAGHRIGQTEPGRVAA